VVFLAYISHRTCQINYLYEKRADITQKLIPYRSYPLIVINNGPEFYPDQFIDEFLHFPYIFKCKSRHFEGLKQAAQSNDILKDGFILFIYAKYPRLNEQQLFTHIKKYIKISEYRKIIASDCEAYFCKPGS
ncbi:MAG: hypothetical protein IJU32_02265, partial [Pyramidobacter sp.]|nr:hypothetical protein [Pyramidobacter sp.]